MKLIEVLLSLGAFVVLAGAMVVGFLAGLIFERLSKKR